MEPTLTPTPLSEILKAPSVLLQGPTGTGKSDVAGELAQWVDKLFLIVTEPNGLESVLDGFARRKVSLDKLHYHVIEPSRANFQELETLAKKVSISTHESLTKASPGSRQGAKLIEVMGVFFNFTCQRTGKAFGNLANRPPTEAVYVDSLSGISSMAWDVTMGDKLTAHQGEWGIAMKLIENAILSWTSNLKCIFVLTAHIERETDDISQGTQVTVSTLGRKLAPKIPRFFSEVVQTSTEGPNFFWNTDLPGVALKHRALPKQAKLPPTFKPIVEKYQERLRQLEAIERLEGMVVSKQ